MRLIIAIETKKGNVSEEISLNKNSDNDSYRDDLSQNNSEDMEQNNNSEANDSNSEDLSEKYSSQETKSIRKLFLDASRNSGEKLKKTEKFNRKKWAREIVRWDDSHHTLTCNSQKMRMENVEIAKTSMAQQQVVMENVDVMFHSMTCQRNTSKFSLKEEINLLLQTQTKRENITIMLQRIVKILKNKNNIFNVNHSNNFTSYLIILCVQPKNYL